MLSPRRRKTSVRFVLERRVSVTKAAVSTGWSRISCVRVVISLTTTAPVENPSMAPGSRTKISSWLIPNLVYYLWQMLAPTLTAASSSSPVPRPAGSTESTSCSEKSSKEWMLLEKYDYLSLAISHISLARKYSLFFSFDGNLWSLFIQHDLFTNLRLISVFSTFFLLQSEVILVVVIINEIYGAFFS